MVNFTLNTGNQGNSNDASANTLGDAHPEIDPLRHPELYIGLIFKRVTAYVIDAIIISVILGVIWVGLGILGFITFGATWGIMGIVLFVVPFAYHTLLIGGASSATFGMQMMNIEVFRWIGGSPDYFQAGAQTILFYGSIALTAWLVLLVAFFGKSRRCLHDYFSGMVVVNKLDGVISHKQIKEMDVDKS